MNRIFSILLTFAWALWLGGLVMLFLAVGSLFQTFSDRHALAGLAASGVFRVFARYRLCVAGAALVLTFVLRLTHARRSNLAAFVLFALAAVAAVYSSALLTPKLEHLRLLGQTHSAQFSRLHGISMSICLVETILVLSAGVPLAWSTTREEMAKATNERDAKT